MVIESLFVTRRGYVACAIVHLKEMKIARYQWLLS